MHRTLCNACHLCHVPQVTRLHRLGGSWQCFYSLEGSAVQHRMIADFVVVCTGLHSTPNIPPVEVGRTGRVGEGQGRGTAAGTVVYTRPHSTPNISPVEVRGEGGDRR